MHKKLQELAALSYRSAALGETVLEVLITNTKSIKCNLNKSLIYTILILSNKRVTKKKKKELYELLASHQGLPVSECFINS